MDFKNKKILVVGLGALGGGVATVKWLVANGATVTVTDLRTRAELRNSLHALGKDAARIRFVLGAHKVEDFISHDIVLVNPAVKIRDNNYLAAAKRNGIPIINDLVIFLDKVRNPVITITGTRGKTTTAHWIAHFLSRKYKGIKASGNSSDDALLKLLPRLEKNGRIPAVLELSSFQLEIANQAKHAPDIAVVTNLYRDHLNRHDSMKEYARAKINIFKNQTRKQKLILNKDNEWTDFFLRTNPKAEIYFFSTEKNKIRNGLIAESNGIVFIKNGKRQQILSREERQKVESLGKHNLYNFLSSALATHCAGISWKDIRARAKKLPGVRYREEIVLKRGNITVINDTTATSPEGAIAAIERFGRMHTILIAGGTDKKLNYALWAKHVKKYVSPENLFLLDGSATKKMVHELRKIGYFKTSPSRVFNVLEKILRTIRKTHGTSHAIPIVILFSPGAASFEKFKNEFDRGEKFDILVKKIFR